MFQDDKTNDIYIENTKGNIIKKFNPGFATFGEVITSNLQNYFASEANCTIYKINLLNNKKSKLIEFFCPPDHPDQSPLAGEIIGCISYQIAGKLFNLNLSTDDNKLVGSAFGGGNVWNVSTGKTIMTFDENDAQTVAAISPDGSYVVTGDIMQRTVNYNFNINLEKGFFYKFPSRPEAAAYYNNGGYPHEVLAAKFIDNNALLLILNGLNNPFNYAALFNPIQLKPTTNPYQTAPYLYDLNPIKYLPLIPNAATDTHYQKDWPLTSDDFSRDEAIDTSPSAHILVMSMAEKNGIIVYRYDPATQTLTREWAGEVKPW